MFTTPGVRYRIIIMEKEAPDSPKTGTTEPKAILVMKSPPAEILDYLYLGNQQQGANKKMLKDIGITRILNVKVSLSYCAC